MTRYTFVPKSWVSINVNPTHLSLIVFKKLFMKEWIDRALLISLHESIYSENIIKRWNVLAQLLKEQVMRFKLEKLPTIINLPAQLVRIDKLLFSADPSPQHIESVILDRVKRDLNHSQENIALDYVKCALAKDQYEVKFVAAKQEYITHFSDCLRAASLDLKIVDVDIFCLQRSLMFNSLTVACVHADCSNITFILTEAHDLLFYKQWPRQQTTTLLAQLHHYLAMAYAALGPLDIKTWFVSGDEQFQVEVRETKVAPIHQFHQIKLASSFQIKTANAPCLINNQSEFVFACGALKRQLPTW